MNTTFLLCFIIGCLKLAVGVCYDEHAAEIETALETEIKKPETKCKFLKCWISNHFSPAIDYSKIDRFTYIVSLAFIEKPKFQRKAIDWYVRATAFLAISFILSIFQNRLGTFKTEFQNITGNHLLEAFLYSLIVIGSIITVSGLRHLQSELQRLKNDCKLHKLQIRINSNLGSILKDSFRK